MIIQVKQEQQNVQSFKDKKKTRNKNIVGELPLGDDRDLQEKEQTNRNVLEDGEIEVKNLQKMTRCLLKDQKTVTKVDRIKIIPH